MAVRIFSTKRFVQECAEAGIPLVDVQKDFKAWKEQGIYPPSFGANYKYDRPSSVLFAEVWHVHFAKDGKWQVQVSRRSPEQHTSNSAIVYCSDNPPWNDHYCLLALLHSEAHEKMRSTNFAITLANMAEDFRRAMEKQRRMTGAVKHG